MFAGRTKIENERVSVSVRGRVVDMDTAIKCSRVNAVVNDHFEISVLQKKQKARKMKNKKMSVRRKG